MTDGYVNPTGRGEKRDPKDALPVVLGDCLRGTRPERSQANAHNAPALGTSSRGYIHAETDLSCDPYDMIASQTGGEPGVSDTSTQGKPVGYKHVDVRK